MEFDRRKFITRLGGLTVLSGISLAALADGTSEANTAGISLVVLYPQPKDVEKFEAEYTKHLALLDEKAGISDDAKPYTVTKFLPGPEGAAPDFYQMFKMSFESMEAFGQTMSTPGMQEVAADSKRISTGGTPLVLVGQPS